MAAPSAKRFVAQFAGGIGYLALAIWGKGGIAVLFAEPALVALALATMAMVVAAYFAGGNVSPGLREDRANRWVLAAFGIIGLAAGYLAPYTDCLDFWTIDGAATRWIGVAFFVIGGGFRLWPVYVLGDRFSGLVAIQPGHKLVTTGIYRVIRHPSYLGMILNALGWSLAFRSGVGVLLTALTLVPLIARIDAEERLLRSEFGADYDAFRARTWRLIPGIY